MSKTTENQRDVFYSFIMLKRCKLDLGRGDQLKTLKGKSIITNQSEAD